MGTACRHYRHDNEPGGAWTAQVRHVLAEGRHRDVRRDPGEGGEGGSDGDVHRAHVPDPPPQVEEEEAVSVGEVRLSVPLYELAGPWNAGPSPAGAGLRAEVLDGQSSGLRADRRPLQRRRRANRDVHRARRDAQANRASEAAEHLRLPPAHPHAAQLPRADRGAVHLPARRAGRGHRELRDESDVGSDRRARHGRRVSERPIQAHHDVHAEGDSHDVGDQAGEPGEEPDDYAAGGKSSALNAKARHGRN